MSHKTPTIAANKRERTGSRYAQRLRSSGAMPAIIYGHGLDPIAISIGAKEILDHLRHGLHVVELSVEGSASETCLVKDLQFGYLGDNVIHIDFARVDLNEEVTIKVHIEWVGTPAEAERAGAILQHDQTELTVTCTVADIPDSVRVDLNAMDGTSLTAGTVPLPESLVLADDPATVIASITFVREEVAAVTEEVGEETVDEAAPEVIGEPAEGEG